MATWEISFGEVHQAPSDAWDMELIAARGGKNATSYVSRATGPAVALVGRSSLTADFKRAWADNAARHLRGEIESGVWPGDGIPTVTVLDDVSVREIAAAARAEQGAAAPVQGEVLLTF